VESIIIFINKTVIDNGMDISHIHSASLAARDMHIDVVTSTQ
jgi:hypothetical protein